MKSSTTIAASLNVDEITAAGILAAATEYSNRGKGLVLVDKQRTERLAELFREKPIWLSAELNEQIGWQFSQAVFALRRAGYKIKTLSLGGRMFAYKLEESNNV